MKKILIWRKFDLGSHVDIYRQIDYSSIAKEVDCFCGGINTNSGNKVWMQGLISEISTQNNQIYFYNHNETWDDINDKYDLIIYSTANLFCATNKEYIMELATCFSNSRIPIYVVSIGAQADSYEDRDALCSYIKNEATCFINAIYKSGGELALRGWFTKEVLDNICSNTAEVTGCPSLYQIGRNIRIERKNIMESDFAPIINGDTKFFSELKYNPKSIYIDQDAFFRILFDKKYYDNISDKLVLKKMINDIGLPNTINLLNNRIKLFYDVPEWMNYIKTRNYSFSYGSRIHGNIVSILCGVPSMIYARDSRTREMAEFYSIPYCLSEPKGSLFDVFINTDYSVFNNSYVRNYDNYCSFLKKHGIVDEVNDNNSFLNKRLPIYNEYIEKRKKNLLEYMICHRFQIEYSQYMRKIKNKIKGIISYN